jgi:hypothetical protein
LKAIFNLGDFAASEMTSVQLKPAPKVPGLRNAANLVVGDKRIFNMLEMFKFANENELIIESLKSGLERVNTVGWDGDDCYPVRSGTLVISTPPDTSFFDVDSRTQGKDRGKYFVYVDPKTSDIYRTEIREEDRHVRNRAICINHDSVDGKPNIIIHMTDLNEYFVEIKYQAGMTQFVDDYAREGGGHLIDAVYGLAIGKKVDSNETPGAHPFHRGGIYYENEQGKIGAYAEDIHFGHKGGQFTHLHTEKKEGNFLGCPIIGFERALFFDKDTISLYPPFQEAHVHVFRAEQK